MRDRLAGIGDEAGPSMAAQLEAISALGWSWLELRTVDGVAIADLDHAAFSAVAAAIERAGVRVPCVASRIASWCRPITGPFACDLRELEALALRCRALGTRFVRVMSYPNDGLAEQEWRRLVLDRMRRLADHAEREGLVLLHENCSGWAGASAGRTVELLEAVGSPALRLLFDTGNGVEYGYDAYDLLTEIAPWVDHVHVKDADGVAAAPEYTPPGAGGCRVADCLRLLAERGYRGLLSIEPHMAVRPHDGRLDAGTGGVERFVAYGRRLEELLAA